MRPARCELRVENHAEEKYSISAVVLYSSGKVKTRHQTSDAEKRHQLVQH